MLSGINALPKELRRLPRLEVELTAERDHGGRRVVDRVLNLSVTGLMLLSQHTIEPGSIEALKLSGEGVELDLRVAIVWSRPSPRWPGVEAGLKLIGITKEAETRLELLIMRVLASQRGRRSSVRFLVGLPAQWRSAGAPMPQRVELIDLSLGGAMISGAHVPAYGDRGLLSLDLGSGLSATAGSVVWRDVHRVPAAAGLSLDPGPEVDEFVSKIVRAVLLEPAIEEPAIDSLGAYFDSIDAQKP